MPSGEIPIPKWLQRRRWAPWLGALIGVAGIVFAIGLGDGKPRRQEIITEGGRQFIRETGGDTPPWVLAVLLASVLLTAFGVAIGVSRSTVPGSPAERRERVEQLSNSLNDALQIIERIRSDIEDAEELVARLEEDAAAKRLLADLQSDEARAVLDELRSTVRRETNRGTWFQFLMGLGFFAGGVIVTVALT